MLLSAAVLQGLRDLQDRREGRPVTTIEMTREEFVEYAKRSGMDSTQTDIAINMMTQGAAIGAGRGQQIVLKKNSGNDPSQDVS